MKKTAIFIKTKDGQTLLFIDELRKEWSLEEIQNIYISWGEIQQLIDVDRVSIDFVF